LKSNLQSIEDDPVDNSYGRFLELDKKYRENQPLIQELMDRTEKEKKKKKLENVFQMLDASIKILPKVKNSLLKEKVDIALVQVNNIVRDFMSIRVSFDGEGFVYESLHNKKHVSIKDLSASQLFRFDVVLTHAFNQHIGNNKVMAIDGADILDLNSKPKFNAMIGNLAQFYDAIIVTCTINSIPIQKILENIPKSVKVFEVIEGGKVVCQN